MLKKLFKELAWRVRLQVTLPIIFSFSRWLIDNGYTDEGFGILSSLNSYSEKAQARIEREIATIKAERQKGH